MTFEEVLAKLDEIAQEVARVERCALCRRSFFRNELSESASCEARVCANCDRLLASSPNLTPILSRSKAA